MQDFLSDILAFWLDMAKVVLFLGTLTALIIAPPAIGFHFLGKTTGCIVLGLWVFILVSFCAGFERKIKRNKQK